MLERLLICLVCCSLGGCALMDEFVFSDNRTDLGRQFETLGEKAEGVKGTAEAGTAALRPVGQLKKTSDPLGEPATEPGSKPPSARAADPAPAGTPPDGTTARCEPGAEGPRTAVSGEFTADGRRTRPFPTADCRVGHEDGPEADEPVSPDRAGGDAPVIAGNMQEITDAATVAVRSIEGVRKNAEALVELARAINSIPLPGRAVEPVTPGARLDGTTLACGPASEIPESAVRGEFTGSGKRTRLFLSYNCRIWHEDDPESEFLSTPDSASLKALCRDPDSGRDQAVFLTSHGMSSTIEVWGLDPLSGALKPLYEEGWGDMESGEYDRWKLERLVAADGTCLWRNRQEARDTVKAAMAALRIRAEKDKEPDRIVPDPMPTREIHAETARKWLIALQRAGGAAILGGAVYADEGARASWRVVQVLSTTRYEWDGALLVFDRRAGKWQSILDVSLDYPMLGMVVKGDHLFAAICVARCYDGRGYRGEAEYNTLRIDLRAKRANVLRLPPSDDQPRKNPPIRNIQEEIFSH